MTSIWRWGLEMKLSMEDFLHSSFRNLQIRWTHVNTDVMFPACEKGARILKASLNASGEYLFTATEITKHQIQIHWLAALQN